MFVSYTYRIVENLIDHDRTCVKHRIIRPEHVLQTKAHKMYDQTVVWQWIAEIYVAWTNQLNSNF